MPKSHPSPVDSVITKGFRTRQAANQRRIRTTEVQSKEEKKSNSMLDPCQENEKNDVRREVQVHFPLLDPRDRNLSLTSTLVKLIKTWPLQDFLKKELKRKRKIIIPRKEVAGIQTRVKFLK
ncbi:hypothetical protein JTE90_009703 [Oedothorax gibbosus]|uniref:Uncharacterized protein n=1 Tax=Oedothorax gibbosus TaxID=931172 RepID=A0AAV6V7G1_9ARAC|nr:hypothetical protein JTE90_009703 [Oedothorax gibbosus]